MTSTLAGKILWADDEIGLLKSQILFLEQKGYQMTAVTNGEDALEAIQHEDFDLIFLDEHMPGMSGIEALQRIKNVSPHTPVVMITKSEEEYLMEDAIGSRIADYLIKPVNPNQILLTVKKILTGKTLVDAKVNDGYRQDFRNIGMAFFDDLDDAAWKDLYRKLVYWELELGQAQDKSMYDIFASQKAEANTNFGKYVSGRYLDWMNSERQYRPLFSHDLLSEKVLPLLGHKPVFFLLIDCMRMDQWKTFEPVIAQYFNILDDDMYMALLPTATQYARNAIFSGLRPLEIANKFPKYWVNDDEDGGKNLHEADFLQELILRKRLNIRHTYNKVVTNEDGKALEENIQGLLRYDLNVIVINFIDLLAHSRAEMNIIKELAPDEAALRSLSASWLQHSSLMGILRKLRDFDIHLVISTDHGSIRVNKPLKIIGDRATTTNLRYKQGKNLNYDPKNRLIFTIKRPQDAWLPQSSVSATYAFAMEDGYFVYPNNYNHFVNHYKDTLQHGGLSLEEMMVPLITLGRK